jgi:biopolymer transport protein TolQ
MEFWKLFWQTGYVGKAVLLVLVFFSVQSWYYILANYFRYRAFINDLSDFNRNLENTRDFVSLIKMVKSLDQSLISKSIKKLVASFGEIYDYYFRNNQLKISDEKSKITLAERELEELILLEKERMLLNLRHGLGFLATTGNVAPFIGLFGTVWGIMKAFHDIGLKGSASLATVAPGIAEALINTAMGLFCAIPAVMAYNYFLLKNERINKELEVVLKKFFLGLKRGFLN